MRLNVHCLLLAALLGGCQPALTEPARPANDSPPPTLPAHFVVLYGMNQNQLSADAKAILLAAATAAKRYPNATLSIVGHASPDEQEPAKLSHRRALMAAGYMINSDGAEPKMMRVYEQSAPNDAPIVELIIDTVSVPPSTLFRPATKAGAPIEE